MVDYPRPGRVNEGAVLDGKDDPTSVPTGGTGVPTVYEDRYSSRLPGVYPQPRPKPPTVPGHYDPRDGRPTRAGWNRLPSTGSGPVPGP